VPHYLLATDADWILDEVRAALEGPDTTLTVCRSGQQVAPAIAARKPDLAVLDLQIGTMGAIAVTMDLRLDETAGRLPHIPILILLDRRADVFLASRAGAEGWLIKPLDSLRLRRAATIVAAGGHVREGVPEPIAEPAAESPEAAEEDSGADVGSESTDGEAALSS
jgi:DNA-binding response OmpR family regulator